MFVEYQRKKAVREIAGAMHHPIVRLLNVMESSFTAFDGGQGQPLWREAFAQTIKDLREVRENLDAVTDQDANRAKAMADVKAQRFELVADGILIAIDKARAAHTDLIMVLSTNNFSMQSMEEYLDQVEHLVGLYRILDKP
jgi:hypothetical protein